MSSACAAQTPAPHSRGPPSWAVREGEQWDAHPLPRRGPAGRHRGTQLSPPSRSLPAPRWLPRSPAADLPAAGGPGAPRSRAAAARAGGRRAEGRRRRCGPRPAPLLPAAAAIGRCPLAAAPHWLEAPPPRPEPGPSLRSGGGGWGAAGGGAETGACFLIPGINSFKYYVFFEHGSKSTRLPAGGGKGGSLLLHKRENKRKRVDKKHNNKKYHSTGILKYDGIYL